MNSVELSPLNALSYCWNKHDDSFILARALRAIAGAVKATFSKYTVTLHDAVAVMAHNPNAWFVEPLSRALAEYKVSHAPDTSRQTPTAGSSPPLPQPLVNSPFSFSLKETDTTRVRFIDGFQTTADVKDAYTEMRMAAGESWVANARLKCRQVNKDAVDDIAFHNKNHYAISKFLVTVTHPDHGGLSIEEVLHVMDKSTRQHKLVRIGSFSESTDGSTTGGAGFPGYSDDSSNKAGCYLQELQVKNNDGNLYQPYKDTKFGLGSPIADNANVGSLWSCGFDALRLGLYQATGYKFSFQVLVAYLEEMISTRDNADDLRRFLSIGKYSMHDIVMELIFANVNKSPAYPYFLKERESRGEQDLPTVRRNVDGFKICERQEILETTDWGYSSTAILGQPDHAFGLYRNQKTDGTFEYTVYDPHNFGKSPDFYTSPNGQGRCSFASAEAAINHVTTTKGGHNGKLDAFYRVPDSAMCFLRDRMMETKGRLEANGDGF